MSAPLLRDLLVMAAIGAAGICGPACMAATGEPTIVCGTQKWEPFIAEASSRTAVPQEWIRAVILAESGGCDEMDGARTTSRAGAMGLMQIMPATWISIRQRFGLGTDPYDPHDNVLAGAAVLQDLCKRYGSPGCIAAYHAGARRFEEYLLSGRPLPGDTLEYVARVQRWLARADNSPPKGKPAVAHALDTPLAGGVLFERRSPTSDRTQRTGPFVPLVHSDRHTGQQRGGQGDVQSP